MFGDSNIDKRFLICESGSEFNEKINTLLKIGSKNSSNFQENLKIRLKSVFLCVCLRKY